MFTRCLREVDNIYRHGGPRWVSLVDLNPKPSTLNPKACSKAHRVMCVAGNVGSACRFKTFLVTMEQTEGRTTGLGFKVQGLRVYPLVPEACGQEALTKC